MFARKTLRQLFFNATIGVGALFLVGVLLAAIPNHHAPAVAIGAPQDPQSTDHPGLQGMDMGAAGSMDPDDASLGEHNAMVDMQHMHHGDTPHMHMTAMRPSNPDDQKRANEIADQLRAGIEKYKDYRVALDDGYKIFMPNIPQQEYHFTNYTNGFLEAFTFDPSRPTSLLYFQTPTQKFKLEGVMFTARPNATEDELNQRVPLSVARWHKHTNFCGAPENKVKEYFGKKPKFGMFGSIHTKEACDAEGGKFYPEVFTWMIHVFPYEDDIKNVFSMNDDVAHVR